MNKQIPFATLRKFLLDLNFSETNGDVSRTFEHSLSDTVFIFRPYQPTETVHVKDLMTVRKMLDERGLMGREEFERWTWQQPVA